MEKEKIVALKAKSTCKAISPLIISDGFLRGWAFDPLRPEIEVLLRVDGVEVCNGWTGHAVADEFYALNTPPSANCGFILPLPRIVLDGYVHQLSVKVAEWKSMPLAPEINQEWSYGSIFGEVKFTAQDFIEGWVAFRSTVNINQLPPVTVEQDGQTHFVIQLTNISPSIGNCQAMGQFRVPQSQFATLRQPVFSCLGTVLRHQHVNSLFKPIGQVESIDHESISGWALNSADPSESVGLQLMVDGLPFKAIRPNVRRNNIAEFLNLLPEEIGIAGFQIDLPTKLKDGRLHTVAIHFRKNGAMLNEKPLSYQHRSEGFNLQQALAMLGKPGENIAVSAGSSKSKTKKRTKHIPPQVAVVILNRNGAPCLDALFESWLRYNTVPAELIVIDHASSDASLDTIKRWESKLPIQTVALDINDSFSASSNRGAKLAKAPYVLFLNNDIVWQQDALPSMLDTLQNTQVGVVGLKLLKTEFTEDNEHISFNNVTDAVVQHLGVRYILMGDQYWPYETSPDSNLPEELYSPQDVPIVTGAVMLCRREEFLALGGFDEGYFYGYEDVEFCLRMTVQQNKRIVCRNDLVALHHHGYTRLTGREPSMIDHQQENQQRLAGQYGLWSKRAFWQSLLDAKNLLTNEIMTIGFIIHNVNGSNNKDQLAVAVELAERVSAEYQNTKIIFLTAESGWNIVSDLHVVISLSPYFDLRGLKFARPDLRTACYINHENLLNDWSINPSLALFDAYLCIDDQLAQRAEKLMPSFVKPIAVSQKAPLADLVDANRLRVLICVTLNPKLIKAANFLAQALKAQGALVYITGSGGWHDEQVHVAEVIIYLHGEPVKNNRKPTSFERRYDAINVLWIVEDIDSLRNNDVAQADQVWLAVPVLQFPDHFNKTAQELRTVELQPECMNGLARHLQHAVEKKIERTFCSS